ncbi:hypothetical protein LCGC14_0602260 [marine sediment metagenome]|uniref:Uncharacterized protein n=1 Tax=marine sediment metagenome TaxID=412755 RepID=A0A0F9RU74_9ZZZZ
MISKELMIEVKKVKPETDGEPLVRTNMRFVLPIEIDVVTFAEIEDGIRDFINKYIEGISTL